MGPLTGVEKWKESRGIITRMSEELTAKNGNRMARRMRAKVFLKDPIHFEDNKEKHITKRGVLF